jgi:hypothetical protein
MEIWRDIEGVVISKKANGLIVIIIKVLYGNT